MYQSGVTTQHHHVLADVQPFVGTHGLPLELVLDWCRAKNYVVDWPDYIMQALKEGARPKALRTKIMSAVTEVYGRDYGREFKVWLDKVLED